MQVFLPQEINQMVEVYNLKLIFSFISPDFGSDRMGVLDTKMEKYLPWRKWYPRMCVYDDVKGWNTLPYLEQANFI
jgi:hypothetical protein